jgi:hypothetical protein
MQDDQRPTHPELPAGFFSRRQFEVGAPGELCPAPAQEFPATVSASFVRNYQCAPRRQHGVAATSQQRTNRGQQLRFFIGSSMITASPIR